MIFSKGTTGLTTWTAGLALARWLGGLQETALTDKRILELGKIYYYRLSLYMFSHSVTHYRFRGGAQRHLCAKKMALHSGVCLHGLPRPGAGEPTAQPDGQHFGAKNCPSKKSRLG
jgi:hypothetical protein